jgi:hypothetical protein
MRVQGKAQPRRQWHRHDKRLQRRHAPSGKETLHAHAAHITHPTHTAAHAASACFVFW